MSTTEGGISQRDKLVRSLLTEGLLASDVSARLDVPEDIVVRIATIAGLRQGGEASFEQQDSFYVPSPAAADVLDLVGWVIDDHVQSRVRCSRRDQALCDSLLLEDITLDEAGNRVPFTRERMRQTLQMHTGLSTRDLHDHRHALREKQRISDGSAFVRRRAMEDPEKTVGLLAAESGLTAAEVIDLLGDEEALRRRVRNTWTVGASDHDILEELRRVANLPGGTPLLAPFYDEHRSPGTIGSVRIIQKLETWTAACIAAGVESRTINRAYLRNWSDDQLREWLRAYIADAGAAATYAGFAAWLKGHGDDGAPSAQTVRNNLGKWGDIVRDALANQEPTADESGRADSLLGFPSTRWDLEETDSDVLVRMRMEQSHLRHHLLGGRREAPCDICGRLLPDQLLVAAHIVPRRSLTNEQRWDFHSAAMLACSLACDSLFEWGYVVVNSSGWTEVGRLAGTADLRELVSQTVGKRCGAFKPATAVRFAEHQALHAVTATRF